MTSKQQRLVRSLGANMAESAGQVAPPANDRFQGFVPAQTGFGYMELSKIIEDPHQPRRTYDEAALETFAEQIKSHGIQQPIQLQWNSERAKWQIVYGHRRYRAAGIAGLTTIPCCFSEDTIDEATLRVRQLMENYQRENLKPLEVAAALDQLAQVTGWQDRRIGAELGMNKSTVWRYRELLKLPAEIQQLVENGELPWSVALELRQVQDPSTQLKLAEQMQRVSPTRDQAKRIIERAIDPSAAAKSEKRRASGKRSMELMFELPELHIYHKPGYSRDSLIEQLESLLRQLRTEVDEH